MFIFFFFFDKNGQEFDYKGDSKLTTNQISPLGGESPFEQIRKMDENGQEYWSARELQTVLGYSQWRGFKDSINRAKTASSISGFGTSDDFADASKIVKAGATNKKISDYHLSRYACYLIAQNGDPRKEEIALAQTYFAVQTRRQELQDEFEQLTEDQQRLAVRGQLKTHNDDLADAAHDAGVVKYGIFQNHGYQGLYGGLTAKDIHEQKGLKKTQKILDHMGSTELAANLFRATQTAEKLRRDKIKGESNANNTHYSVGKAVRDTIKGLGGTMPEDLPCCEDIKQVEKRVQKISAGSSPKQLK